VSGLVLHRSTASNLGVQLLLESCDQGSLWQLLTRATIIAHLMPAAAAASSSDALILPADLNARVCYSCCSWELQLVLELLAVQAAFAQYLQ
jgi:hypothetical protein